jgi:hypothetical protein
VSDRILGVFILATALASGACSGAPPTEPTPTEPTPSTPAPTSTFLTADSYADNTKLDVADTSVLPSDAGAIRVDGLCAFYVSRSTASGEGTLTLAESLEHAVEAGTQVTADATCR